MPRLNAPYFTKNNPPKNRADAAKARTHFNPNNLIGQYVAQELF